MTQTKSPSSLEAGRELDALIAEKVFGFEVIEVQEVNPLLAGLRRGLKGRKLNKTEMWECLETYKKLKNGKYLPHYSTDIAAAWQVVEKLRADCVFANIGPDPSEGGGYNCQFHWAEGHDEFDIRLEDAAAPTAPLAICRAALKVVKGQATDV